MRGALPRERCRRCGCGRRPARANARLVRVAGRVQPRLRGRRAPGGARRPVGGARVDAAHDAAAAPARQRAADPRDRAQSSRRGRGSPCARLPPGSRRPRRPRLRSGRTLLRGGARGEPRLPLAAPDARPRAWPRRPPRRGPRAARVAAGRRAFRPTPAPGGTGCSSVSRTAGEPDPAASAAPVRDSRCLFVSDLHGRQDRYQKLLAAIRAERPGAVFLGRRPAAVGAARSGAAPRLPARLARAAARVAARRARVRLPARARDLRQRRPALAGALARRAPGARACWSTSTAGASSSGACRPSATPACRPRRSRSRTGSATTCRASSTRAASRRRRDAARVPVAEGEARWGTIAGDLEALAGAEDVSRAVFLFHSPPHRTALDRAALDGRPSTTPRSTCTSAASRSGASSRRASRC